VRYKVLHSPWEVSYDTLANSKGAKIMGDLNKPKKGAAKVRHLGRKKNQIARYYAQTYPKKKITNILRHQGAEAARSWALAHDALRVYLELVGV